MLTVQHTRDDFARQPCTTAVLPVGAIEQHGSHLPVGTDLLLAQSFAERLAARLDAYLLPPLAITSSIEHRKAKGTVYLRADTLALVMRDIAASLRDSGFTRLVVANFHGGNWILKPTIRQFNRDHPGFRAVLLSPDLPAVESAKIFEHVAGDVHGGEYETSLMLHLHPNEVRPLPKGHAEPASFPPQAYLDYFDTTELTPRGHWGWPAAATADKGKRAFELLVELALRGVADIETMAKQIAAAGRPEVTVRCMTAADVSFAHHLNTISGWNQTEKDWRGYLEFEPDGCFVAEVAGRATGTATTIRYGDRFGWIGMVLVHPDFRRFGIGTKLLRHTIEYIQRSGTRCVKLDATPMGKQVYVPLGFVEEYEMSRYQGDAPAGVVASNVPRALEPEDLDAVVAYDAPLFGAERARVLRSMMSRNPELCFIVRDGTAIRGYLIAREGRQAIQVGPWLAEDGAVGEHLLRALFARIAGRRLYVDVPHPNGPGRALMEKYGFTIQRGLTRMYLGENRHPGVPEKIFSVSSPEKG